MELGGIGSYDKVVFPYGGYGLMYMVLGVWSSLVPAGEGISITAWLLHDFYFPRGLGTGGMPRTHTHLSIYANANTYEFGIHCEERITKNTSSINENSLILNFTRITLTIGSLRTSLGLPSNLQTPRIFQILDLARHIRSSFPGLPL